MDSQPTNQTQIRPQTCREGTVSELGVHTMRGPLTLPPGNGEVIRPAAGGLPRGIKQGAGSAPAVPRRQEGSAHGW